MGRSAERIWMVLDEDGENPQIGYYKWPLASIRCKFITPDPEIMDQSESYCLVHFTPEPEDASRMKLGVDIGKKVRIFGNGVLETVGEIKTNGNGVPELHIPFNSNHTIIFEIEYE
jgi:hypothetical protein